MPGAEERDPIRPKMSTPEEEEVRAGKIAYLESLDRDLVNAVITYIRRTDQSTPHATLNHITDRWVARDLIHVTDSALDILYGWTKAYDQVGKVF